MFTSFNTVNRVAQASVIGVAIAFTSLASVAQAKSPMRGFMAPQTTSVKSATAATNTVRGLPTNLKSGIENLSGKNLGNVRVHTNTKAAGNLNARAFTKGTKIHLAPGQMKHLPHEAWHAVQQKNGRVLSNAARNLETQADAYGDAKRMRKVQKSAAFAKKAKAARTLAKTHQAAKVARHANTLRKGAKAANTARNIAKIAAAGTGVGAVVGITAGLAGVDPIEMATLKATNPAEYNRRMQSLKKNPVKYMGNNIKNNTKKVASNVGNATKKAGCGIGNVFKKKGTKKKC